MYRIVASPAAVVGCWVIILLLRVRAGRRLDPALYYAAGIPERTYWRRLARHRVGDPPKGPWPAPRVAVAAKYAADWPAWGHRKIAAMVRADGHQVSTSTVQRPSAGDHDGVEPAPVWLADKGVEEYGRQKAKARRYPLLATFNI
jgi:hypothetical protein